MPATFPSVGPNGTQSLSLVPQSSDKPCERTDVQLAATTTVVAAGLDDSIRDDSRPLSIQTVTSQSVTQHTPVDAAARPVSRATSRARSTSASTPLHRISEVRQQQGLSLRTISRRSGLEAKELRRQEAADCDLTLSQLKVWQKALDVPLVDLLEDESQSLSRPVKERAKMVRIMKTVVSLCEACESNVRLQRLTAMLREQILDLMPELEEIGGWPQCGSRRVPMSWAASSMNR